MTDKKTTQSLYLGFAVVCAAIAGIWSFTANRFRWDECFFIVIASAVIGCGLGLLVQVLCGYFKNKAAYKKRRMKKIFSYVFFEIISGFT